MSGSTARQNRAAGKAKPPEVIALGDLTIDELDEVEALAQAGTCGRTVGTVFVWRRRRNTAYTLDDARQVRARDIRIVDDTEEGDDDTPTPAP